MHRLLVDPAILDMDCAILAKDGAAHLHVLRPKDGEEFELFDGRGSKRTYKWSASAKSLFSASAKSTQHRNPAEPQSHNLTISQSHNNSLILFACITKGQRWDWTLQKATELGISKIVPVISARTIVRIAPGEGNAKKARWQKICEEAARQSDALWLPEISEPLDFASAVREAAATTCFVGALTTPPPEPLLDVAMRSLENGAHGEFSTFIGPEGDFTPEELSALLKVATPASFGPTILRAETAAIFAISVLTAAIKK